MAIFTPAAALHLWIFHAQHRPDGTDITGMNHATIPWHAAPIFTNITAETGFRPIAMITVLIAIGSGIPALMTAWQIRTGQFTF